MEVLLHPKISWQGWQEVKLSSFYQKLSLEEKIDLVNQLPQGLWAWEMSEGSEIDALLDGLVPEGQEKE
jgi:hypothetical protein